MKIQEVLLEFEIPGALREIPIADIFGTTITAGQISDAIPGVDPKTVIKYGKQINDVVQTNLTPNYTVGDAIADIAVILPIGRALKGAKTITQATGALGGVAARRELGSEIASNIKILPDMPSLPRSSTNIVAPQPEIKKKRKAVGEVIPVPVNGKQYNLPIVKVLPNSGYTVDASKIPGKKPGETLDAPEPEVKL
jgi:hypothetical protein